MKKKEMKKGRNRKERSEKKEVGTRGGDTDRSLRERRLSLGRSSHRRGLSRLSKVPVTAGVFTCRPDVLRSVLAGSGAYTGPGSPPPGTLSLRLRRPGGHPVPAWRSWYLCRGKVSPVTSPTPEAKRQRARQVRAGLRLVVPPPKVEVDKRRLPRSRERQAVRRAWREGVE